MIKAGKLVFGAGFLICMALGQIAPAQEKKTAEDKKEKPTRETPKELTPFQGTWKLDKVLADGNILPPNLFGEGSLVIKGPDYTLTQKTNREVQVNGKLSVPQDQGPFKDKEPVKGQDRVAELIPVDITPESEGKALETQKAVFAILDGKLYLCSGPPNIPRPKTLNTLAKENVVLMVFGRTKP